MKRKQKILFECFKGVKSEYFPRWDKKGEWSVIVDDDMVFEGLCDKEKKIISIKPNHTKDNKLSQVLIHEICHAFTNNCHGKIWQRRMIKVSELAKYKGNNFLGKLLSQDIEEYQKVPNEYTQVYEIIKDWVNENPELT